MKKDFLKFIASLVLFGSNGVLAVQSSLPAIGISYDPAFLYPSLSSGLMMW